MTTQHLSEAELEEALMGIASAECTQHAETCAECRKRMDSFKASMAAFSEASMGWSHARSNSLSRDLTRHRTAFRLSTRFVWSCASVAVLAVAGIAGVGVREHHQAMEVESAAVRPTSADSSEIASDNAMMRQIHAELDRAEPSPDELYRAAPERAVRRGSERN